MPNRLLTLIISGFVIIFAINGFYIFKLRNNFYQNYHSLKNRTYELLSVIIKLQNESLLKLVSDYTIWDEMVNYVKSPDSIFERDNFITSSQIYNADYLMVFDKEGKKVFQYRSPYAPEIELNNYISNVPDLFSDTMLIHFYLYDNKIVKEFFAGSIHPSFDSLRITAPAGYFFVGKLWDEKFQNELSRKSEVELHIVSDSQSLTDKDYKVSFFYPLTGDTVLGQKAWLYVMKSNPTLKQIEKKYKAQLMVVIILCVIFLAVVTFFTNRWFIQPIKLLKKAVLEESFTINNKIIGKVAEYQQMLEIFRKTIEQKQELKVSNQLYERLLALFPVAVIITDADFKIVMVNEKVTDLFGTDKENIKGKTLQSIFPDPVQSVIEDKLKKIEENQKFEIQWVDRNNNTVYLEVNISALKTEDKKQNLYLFSLHNQTMLKLQQKTLREALQKAEESDKLKTSFLLSLSHEIRTPLNVIIGLSSVANDNTPKSELIEYFDIIRKSGIQLSEIIDDLFDISLIESGNLKVNFEEIRIGKIAEDVLKLVQAELKLKNSEDLKLIYKPDESENDQMITDPVRIKQILINLLKNALKFTERGEIELGYQINRKKQECVIYVRDTGIGIKEADQQKIFDKFWQANQNNHKTTRGAGLGLYISKKLANLLHGDLWVKSEINKGSIFYFSFPLVPPKKSITMKDDSLIAGKLKGKKILLAEDEDFNFMLVNHLLRKYGCEVLRAVNGKEAIEIFNQEKDLDAIIMDIRMPVMSGTEAIKEIRKKNSSIPIIALTALVISGSKEEIMDYGADDYLEKPFNPELLFEKLNHLLK